MSVTQSRRIGGFAARASRWGRVLFYWTIKTIAWPVTRAYLRLSRRGTAHVPDAGPCLVVANHTSYLDAVVLGSCFPRRITFMITEPIYRLNRLRWFYSLMGTIPVADGTPDPGALKSALKVLSDGGVVGIFPEGQRVPDGSSAQYKAGVALIAARSGVPVVPAAIIGAKRAMPIGSVFPRPYAVRVAFGPPLVFPPWQGRRPSREQLEEFANVIMNAIAHLMGEDRPASVSVDSNMSGVSR